MPLYRVTFAEPGGARVECYLPAAVGVDHITLAVHHLWGPQCYWVWVPGSDTEGRVYERVGAAPGPQDVPRTGPVTVEVTPARRRPRPA
jgi:hypothetical protein